MALMLGKTILSLYSSISSQISSRIWWRINAFQIYKDSECLFPTHPLLGTYLRMFSRKTREERKENFKPRNGGSMPPPKKTSPWTKTPEVQRSNQPRLNIEKTPRKNKSVLKLALSLVRWKTLRFNKERQCKLKTKKRKKSSI